MEARKEGRFVLLRLTRGEPLGAERGRERHIIAIGFARCGGNAGQVKATSRDLETLRRLLCRLQEHIRDAVIDSRRVHAKSFARVAAVTEADTIYQVDRISEDALVHWFEAHWPKRMPVQVVMEGLEDDEVLAFPRGTELVDTKWKCILDPIDGTRCLMYDKRSAWSLAGIAPQRGAKTNLTDIVVAAMTELPTTKQSRSDQFSAVRGGRLHATSYETPGCKPRSLKVWPSTARDFKHGFASFARFFPDGRTLTSRVEEDIWAQLHKGEGGASPLVFDDQYISSGGQLHELLTGRDRMVADIRPLVFRKLGINLSLVCHPYDLCVGLLLESAGGILEAPMGGPVRAPLDTTTPVAWLGYANAHLARLMRPVLRRALRKHLGVD